MAHDPFRPLLSLADQKTLIVQEKLAEKNASLAEDPALTLMKEHAEARARLRGTSVQQSNLLDIAQSSAIQEGLLAADIATGVTRPNEEVIAEADRIAGVTDLSRYQNVTQPQEEVTQSLAEGRILDAALAVPGASPGTLADSAGVVPGMAIGAAVTSGIGGIFKGVKRLFGGAKKVKKAVETQKKLNTRMAMIKEAAKQIPKTAGQMSVVTATITQRQIADYRKENNGEYPSREQIARFYGLNLIAMTAQGGIIKQLFIPKFKKEFVREAKAVFKNMGKNGSNLVSIGMRIGDGLKKTLIAGGAEAAQEYMQTWVEIVNVSIGPNEDFLKGLKRVTADEGKQVEALAGAFLGAGAGGLARAGIAAPGVAAGTAIDVTKGTVKTAVKAVSAVVGAAGKITKHVVDKSAFQILSKEEVDTILSEHKSKKTVLSAKVADLQSSVDKIKKANTIGALLQNEEIANRASKIIQKNELTDEDLKDKKVLNKLKRELISIYRGDIGLLETELLASTGASFVKKGAKNIQEKSVKAAIAVVEAVDPGIKAVLKTVADLGPKVIKAVEEIQSSTARGMIEIAANAGKEEIKTILEAAKSLSLEDLQRVTAVIGEINTDLGLKLRNSVKDKIKSLEHTGLKTRQIINEETIDPIVAEVADRGNVDEKEVASLSSALNKTVAGNIDDIVSLEMAEKALALVEASENFKQQKNGAMSRDGAVVVKRKLKKARARLEGIPEKVKEAAKSAAKKAKEAIIPIVDTIVEKTKAAVNKITPKIKAKIKKLDKMREKIARLKDLAQDLFDEGKKKSGEKLLDTRQILKKAAEKLDKEIDKDLGITIVETVKGAAETVVETVKGVIDEANKIKIKPAFRAVIDLVAKTLKDPKQVQALVDSAKDFVKHMKKAGIKTRAQFEAFIAEFPDLETNVPFFKQLDDAYPNKIVADEIFDNITTKVVETAGKIKDAFVELFPTCKI